MKSFFFLGAILTATTLYSQGLVREHYDSLGQFQPSPPNSFTYMVGKKNQQGYFYDSVKTYYASTGKLKAAEVRDKYGTPTGNYKTYHKDGKLQSLGRYEHKNFKLFQSSPDSTERTILQYFNEGGIQQVSNGHGRINGLLDDHFTEGKVVNGLKDSLWQTFQPNGKLLYQESWHEGELVDGLSYDAQHHEFYYKQLFEMPAPNMSYSEFYERMGEKITYPKDAERRGIIGKVIIEITVDVDGSLTDPRIVQGIGFGCDEEAVRALLTSDRWKPAMLRGQHIKHKINVPFLFRLT